VLTDALSDRSAHGLVLPDPSLLIGTETLLADVRIQDFWAWAYSDLATNTTRSILAEYLVARALGDRRPIREEWANYDVLTRDGIRVEVKAAGYLQRWRQSKPSTIRFGRFTGRSWDADTGTYDEARSVRADVFVFAVQSCTDPAAYDPLDVGQWEFFVVPASVIAAHGYRSANVAWVARASGGPVDYADLSHAVQMAAATEEDKRVSDE
jgi:hypothetical protein